MVAYLARLTSPGSRVTMRRTLDRIARRLSEGRRDAKTFPWASLRHPHVLAIRADLAERLAPTTANLGLAALRGVLEEAWTLGLIPDEDYRRAIRVKPVAGERLPPGRALTQAEIRALLAVCDCDRTPAGPRDAAIFLVGARAGPRRAELVGLDLADVADDRATLTIRQGKGRKDRITHLPPTAAKRLATWVAARRATPGPLFVTVRDSRVPCRRLTTDAIYAICRRRAAEARIPPFAPHDLRRTFLTNLWSAGIDASLIQGLAGHASLVTTQRYDRRGQVARRDAVVGLDFDDGPTTS